MSQSATEVYVDPNFAGIGTNRMCKYRGAWLFELFFPTPECIDAVLNMNIRPDDLLLVSFQKSGTTWLQEVVLQISCLKHKELAERTTANGKRKDLEELFPMIDEAAKELGKLDTQPSPRFLKFHLPYQLLPTAAQNGAGKILYIARDVRDVAVSYFHFMQYLTITNYTGTLEDMCKEFLNDTVPNGPWMQHVKDFWDRRNEKNILFLTYEDMKMDPAEGVRRVAEFLEVSLTPEQIEEIVVATSFESMKKNDSVNYSWLKEKGMAHPDKDFMRKGITGDWKNHISEELGAAMEKKFLQPLRECGLVFGNT